MVIVMSSETQTFPFVRTVFLRLLCRIWGIVTAIVMWGVGTELSFDRYPLGAFILVGAFLVTFLETAFVLDLFLRLWVKDDGHWFLNCWELLMLFDYWKKTVFYIIIGCICFVHPVYNWLGTIPGVMLLILGFSYLLLTIKMKQTVNVSHSLMNVDDDDDSKISDGFDIQNDSLDDGFPDPTDGSISSQDRILEV
ncbi:Uncharacterised protein g6124 [Pycnogonum litorale]